MLSQQKTIHPRKTLNCYLADLRGRLGNGTISNNTYAAFLINSYAFEAQYVPLLSLALAFVSDDKLWIRNALRREISWRQLSDDDILDDIGKCGLDPFSALEASPLRVQVLSSYFYEAISRTNPLAVFSLLHLRSWCVEELFPVLYRLITPLPTRYLRNCKSMRSEKIDELIRNMDVDEQHYVNGFCQQVGELYVDLLAPLVNRIDAPRSNVLLFTPQASLYPKIDQ